MTPIQERTEDLLAKYFEEHTMTECGCSACTTYRYTLRDELDYSELAKDLKSALRAVQLETAEECLKMTEEEYIDACRNGLSPDEAHDCSLSVLAAHVSRLKELN